MPLLVPKQVACARNLEDTTDDQHVSVTKTPKITDVSVCTILAISGCSADAGDEVIPNVEQCQRSAGVRIALFSPHISRKRSARMIASASVKTMVMVCGTPRRH